MTAQWDEGVEVAHQNQHHLPWCASYNENFYKHTNTVAVTEIESSIDWKTRKIKVQ